MPWFVYVIHCMHLRVYPWSNSICGLNMLFGTKQDPIWNLLNFRFALHLNLAVRNLRSKMMRVRSKTQSSANWQTWSSWVSSGISFVNRINLHRRQGNSLAPGLNALTVQGKVTLHRLWLLKCSIIGSHSVPHCSKFTSPKLLFASVIRSYIFQRHSWVSKIRYSIDWEDLAQLPYPALTIPYLTLPNCFEPQSKIHSAPVRANLDIMTGAWYSQSLRPRISQTWQNFDSTPFLMRWQRFQEGTSQGANAILRP